jgi:hypothetical protein
MEIAVALDTDSRTRTAGFAAKRVLEAARAVRGTDSRSRDAEAG